MPGILITGGTGRLGRALTTRLLQLGYEPFVLSSKQNSLLPPGVKVVYGDLTDASSLQNLKDHELIIHCASNPLHFKSVDVDGTKNLLHALKGGRTKHFIYVSIVGVDKSNNPYYLAKHRAESLVINSGIEWTILRATQFHDFVLNMFIKPFHNRESSTIQIPAGLRFQSVDIGDVVSQLIEVMQAPPTKSIKSIVGPETLTIEEMAERYIDVLGSNSRISTKLLEDGLYSLFRSGANLGSGETTGKISWRSFLENLKQS